MTPDEFQNIQDRKWEPVCLHESSLPKWMRSLHEETNCHIFASGSKIGGMEQKNHKYVIGGIEVYRDATEHPEPEDWNRDYYIVVKEHKTDDLLLVYGPLENELHHTNEIPDHLTNAEVLVYERKAKTKDK